MRPHLQRSTNPNSKITMFAHFHEYHRNYEMANSQGDGNAFATPRSSTWIVLNCILFVIGLDSCCWLLDKGLSRVLKGQTGFEFWVLRFRFLGASFSRFGCSVFEFWVLRFRDLGALFSRFGCFVLRSSFSSASVSKLPMEGLKYKPKWHRSKDGTVG